MATPEYIHVSASSIEGGAGGERLVRAGETMLIAEWTPLDVSAVMELELILYPTFGDPADAPANLPQVLSWWMTFAHGLVEHRVPVQPMYATGPAIDAMALPANGVYWRFSARRARVFVHNAHVGSVQFIASVWEANGGTPRPFPVDFCPAVIGGGEGEVWRRFPIGAREWRLVLPPAASPDTALLLKAADGTDLTVGTEVASDVDEWTVIPADVCYWTCIGATAVFR